MSWLQAANKMVGKIGQADEQCEKSLDMVSQIDYERRAGLVWMRWPAGTETKQNAALQPGVEYGLTYGLCLVGTMNVKGAFGGWVELTGESEAKDASVWVYVQYRAMTRVQI